MRDAPGVGGRKTRQIQPSSSLLYQGVLLQARVALFVRPLSLGLTLPLWTNKRQDTFNASFHQITSINLAIKLDKAKKMLQERIFIF